MCGLGAVQGDNLRLLHVWAYLAVCVFAKTTAVRNIWVFFESFQSRLVLRRTEPFPSEPRTLTLAQTPKIKTNGLRKDPRKDDKG